MKRLYIILASCLALVCCTGGGKNDNSAAAASKARSTGGARESSCRNRQRFLLPGRIGLRTHVFRTRYVRSATRRNRNETLRNTPFRLQPPLPDTPQHNPYRKGHGQPGKNDKGCFCRAANPGKDIGYRHKFPERAYEQIVGRHTQTLSRWRHSIPPGKIGTHSP